MDNKTVTLLENEMKYEKIRINININVENTRGWDLQIISPNEMTTNMKKSKVSCQENGKIYAETETFLKITKPSLLPIICICG